MMMKKYNLYIILFICTLSSCSDFLAQLAVDRQSGDGGNPGGGDQTGDGNQSGNGDQTGDGGQQQSSTADDNSSELSSTGSSVTPMVLSAIALMLAGISVIRIRRSSR